MENGDAGGFRLPKKREHFVTSTPTLMQGLDYMHASREGTNIGNSPFTLPDFKPVYPVRKLKSLCSLSSGHGVPFASRTKYTIAKVFWSVVFLCGLGALSYCIYVLTTEYLSSRRYFRTSIETDKETHFPSVTICNENIFKRSNLMNLSAVLKNSKYKDMISVDDYYSNVSAIQVAAVIKNIDIKNSNDIVRQWLNNYPSEYTESILKSNQLEKIFAIERGDWNSLYAVADVKLRRKIFRPSSSDLKQFGHKIDDVLVKCEINGASCNASVFTTVQHSHYGNCFNLQHAASSYHSDHRGVFLILDLESYEYVRFLSEVVGAKIFIHPASARFYDVTPIEVAAGVRNVISVKKVVTEHLKPECEEKKGFVHGACLEKCLADNIYRTCGCSHYGDGQTTDCNPFNRTQYLCKEAIEYLYSSDVIECNCKQSCRETSYVPLMTSQFTWPSIVHLPHLQRRLVKSSKPTSLDYIRHNLAYVEINLDSAPVEQRREQQFSWIWLLIYIGGASAFFVGISCISVIEFGAMMFEIFNIVCCSCRRRRKDFKSRIQMLGNFNDLEADTSASFVAGKPEENNFFFGGSSLGFDQLGMSRRMYLPNTSQQDSHLSKQEGEDKRPISAKVAPIRHEEPSRPFTAGRDLHRHAWEHDDGKEQLYGRVLVSGKARNIQEAPLLNELMSQATDHRHHHPHREAHSPYQQRQHHQLQNHHKRQLPVVPGSNRSRELLISDRRGDESQMINPNRRRLPLNYHTPTPVSRGLDIMATQKKSHRRDIPFNR